MHTDTSEHAPPPPPSDPDLVAPPFDQRFNDAWQRWHTMEHAPTNPRAWLQWAVAQFTSLYEAPQPASRQFKDDVNAWARAFDNWGRQQSNSIRAICGYILSAYNSEKPWKCRLGARFAYKTLADAAKNWDDGNRRGMARLILQAKGI